MLKKVLLAIFLITITTQIISAEVIRTVRPLPINKQYFPYHNNYNNYYNPNYYHDRFLNRHPLRNNPIHYNNINNYRNFTNDINNLEQYAFNRSYSRDNDINRLERLEMLAYGATQQGDISTRYDNVKNTILSRPQTNYKPSLLNNISNFFNGQITGLTPQLTQFDNSNYQNYITPNNSIEKYYGTTSPFGNRYYYTNSSNGSGSGIHILD